MCSYNLGSDRFHPVPVVSSPQETLPQTRPRFGAPIENTTIQTVSDIFEDPRVHTTSRTRVMFVSGMQEPKTLGPIIMKEHLPTLIIICIALAWSEFRYQQLSSRIENMQTNGDTYHTKTFKKDSKITVFDQKKNGIQQSSASAEKQSTTRAMARKLEEMKKKSNTEPSASLDLNNPDVQEELHQFLEEREREQKEIKRAEGLGKYLDYVDKKIETYAQNHQLPSSVSQAVMVEIQTRTNEYVAVEHAAEDGEMDWTEAKPEMERIKEEGKTNLIDILGEEEYQEFERFVWGRE